MKISIEQIIDKAERFSMCEDPIHGLTPEIAEEIIDYINTESDLAGLFAAFQNRAQWVEDNEYDFEKGTKEYENAVQLTESWFALADKLRYRIFEILRAEGLDISSEGQVVVLEPFMKRNGFRNRGGWWIRIDV